MNIPKTLLIGFGAGVASGLLGIGGAIVLVPGMVYAMGFSQHMASATSLAVVIPGTIVSAAVYRSFGQLDMGLAALFAIGGMMGVYLGSSLLPRINALLLKRLFATLALSMAIRMWFA